ncbi:MAG: hypothetical protein HYS17_10745 [Micavibrio aeruginosavorus]|uniref:Uncharacterized protein n=1 Tax=Micavibrio aeruginosavorus TaxID=349221 RepID=A0A7T5R1S3_9BACT|nr:MAG: hypothetical protein HYS17_10745 [Micavibrio aeruginosavorus]
MTYQAEAVSPECRTLEHHLSLMLSRVERRQEKEPAAPADGQINNILYGGLRDTMRLTQSFMAACAHGYSLEYRARRLSEFASGMHRVVDMVHALEGEKHLSPLFDRMMNREYAELQTLVFQMRDVVYADAPKLKNPPPVSPKAPDPFSMACTLMMMPALLAWGVMSGFAAGLREAAEERAQVSRPPRHLKLVHNR